MISPNEFVKAWQSCGSTAEVCQKLKMFTPQKEKDEDTGETYEVVDEDDRPIMVPNTQKAATMAGALRTQGVKLKKFRTKRKALTADDITALNSLCGVEADEDEEEETTPPKKVPTKKKKKRRQPAG